MQKLTRSLIALSGLVALAACGDDVSVTPPPETPPPTVTSVTVSPAQATIKVGEKLILSANVAVNGSGVNTAVTWASANSAIASVSATGEVTGVAAGQTTVRATSAANAGVSGSAAITVSADKGVQSVAVSPTSAILAPTQTLQAVANVTTTSGVAKTVTWASSATSVATVDATGKITAVAPGAATITATSTVDPTVAGSLALTVRQPAPATISIKSVTTGATNVPVNFNNVAGQIDATLNVDPGDQVISKVEILLDNAVVYSQAFSAQQSHEMSLAAVSEALAEIVGSINTADFDQTTGVAKYFNGARQLSARAVVQGGTQVATPSITLQFNNANRLIQQLILGGTRASAVSTGGLAFERGSLTVSVLPVIYQQGRTMAAGSTTFGGSDASGVGARTAALVAPAGGTGAWTATFSDAGANAVGNVSDYEYNGPGAGENATVTATDNQGNQLFANAAPFSTPANPAPVVRLDNRAPGAPTFMANPNNRQNGWLNASVGLTGLNAGLTDNDWLVDGAADAGVGGYTRWLRVGTDVATAKAAAPSSTPSLPAPSATNTSYCAVISATDLLGNESALPVTAPCTAPPAGSSTAVPAQHLSFGVDIAAPTIAFSGGLASGARINTPTVGTEFQVTVQDTGTVGNSGMLSGSAVVGTVTLRNVTASGAATCVLGSYTGGVCTPVSVNGAPAFPLVPTTTIAANTSTGYFTYVAVAQDAAGNQSAPVTRVVAHDDAVNVPNLTQALFNTPLSGSTATFNANASDNFDLWTVNYTLTYAGGLAGPIAYPAVTLNTFNVSPLVYSNVPAGITINGFMRQVENVTGTSPLTVGGAFKPTSLTGIALDQANNPSVAAVTAISAAAVTTGTSYTAVAATLLTDSWAITAPAAATNVSTGATSPAANALSVTFTARACGPTATYAPPFTRVDFYAVSGGNMVQIGTATPGSTVDNGAAFGRCHPYTFTWTPGAAFGTAAQSVYAIGVNANGDALVTQANTQVTTTNP